MHVVVKLFASMREKVGTDMLTLEVPEGANVAQAVDVLQQHHPALTPYLANVRFALHMDFVEVDTALTDGDEVGLIPPVSGGHDGMFQVTTERLNLQQIHDLVKRSTDGAVVTFDGIVRNNFDGHSVRFLEYEAYAAMAAKKMAEIGAEVQHKFAVGEIAMAHRIGRLEIGESSILISVAAPHRQAAFEACAYAMDRVKAEVPVWKKEFFADGDDHWVNQDA